MLSKSPGIEPSVAINNIVKNSRSFFKPAIQPKLAINQPNDVFEQEADAMADKVMHKSAQGMSFFRKADFIQRKCEKCEEDTKLQRKENHSTWNKNTVPTDFSEVIKASGNPLPENTRKFFESRFEQDFSDVRVHSDVPAGNSAQSINAKAYTTGNKIVFNRNQFQPDSDSGKWLLAHELTHIIQQRNRMASRPLVQKYDSLVGSLMAKRILDFQELEKHIAAGKWGDAYSVLSGQWMKIMMEYFLDNLPLISINDLINRANDPTILSSVGEGGRNRILGAVLAAKTTKDAATRDPDIEIARQKIAIINFDQRLEIRDYLKRFVKTSAAAKKLYDILSKPFIGRTASAFDFSDRFLKHSDKLGFEIEQTAKSLPAFKSPPYIDPQPTTVTDPATKSFEKSDILFFSGHQYAQYQRPGVFTNDSSEYCFNIGAISKKLNKVKLIVSTSCATICKDTARIFNEKFPNALVLGYRLSAPINGGILSQAFSDALVKEGPIDISERSGLDKIIKIWKSVTINSGGLEGQPGYLFEGKVEFWNGKNWQKDSADSKANACHYH